MKTLIKYSFTYFLGSVSLIVFTLIIFPIMTISLIASQVCKRINQNWAKKTHTLLETIFWKTSRHSNLSYRDSDPHYVHLSWWNKKVVYWCVSYYWHVLFIVLLPVILPIILFLWIRTLIQRFVDFMFYGRGELKTGKPFREYYGEE